MSFLFVHGAGDPDAEDGSFRLLERLKRAADLAHNDWVAPILPNPETPNGALWAEELTVLLNELEDGSTVIAHSFGGCCTLAALAGLPRDNKAKRLILVAMPHWGIDPDWPSSAFSLPREYADHLVGSCSVDLFYSTDDDIVPVSHLDHYLKEIPFAKGHILNGTGHSFGSGDISAIEIEVS